MCTTDEGHWQVGSINVFSQGRNVKQVRARAGEKKMQMSGLGGQQISRHTLLVSFDGPQTERRLIKATSVGRPGTGPSKYSQ